MSSVVVIFRIYPKEGRLDEAMSEIRTKLKPADMRSEEVAFGIKLIRAMFKFDDAEKGSSKIEEQIKALENVGEVEVEEETLL
jgi:translation elongation factor EF-1beta